MAGARVQPVVLVFEDLHWDPTTLDVLGGMAERGALAPLFIVATTWPEFRPPWGMRSHHGTISLAPLDRLQVREMVAELSARHALPREVAEGVAACTKHRHTAEGVRHTSHPVPTPMRMTIPSTNR
jgi:predicted ATPase